MIVRIRLSEEVRVQKACTAMRGIVAVAAPE